MRRFIRQYYNRRIRRFARRDFLTSLGALAWSPPKALLAAEFPVRFRKPNPYESLLPLVEPGQDEFLVEKEAAEITARLEQLFKTGSLPLEGPIQKARFFVLPGGRVRYEAKGEGSYRVGTWRMSPTGLVPLEETVAHAAQPLFHDVTAELFRDTPSFHEQLARGVPYWRSRLDPASGIDVYGNNGIAVGDADGDGWDEVYVCQPGGLPNRLYHRRPDGAWEDITERSGLGVLDDTASALFLDLRNTGSQDLVVLTSAGPLLFLNEGAARYRHVPDAFRFATAPQGSFTGMCAADYDRDGKLDLYLCSYLYFQSEDRYRYPVPYHDAQNGPPNFLFRNRLGPDGSGGLEDVTAASGMSENNNRYSFAAAWCDYDGDGWPDLYVANDFGRNNLYRNERGRFRDVAAQAGVEDMGPGMSAAWFDYDGDGRPDLYVANMWTAAGQRVVADPAFRLSPDAYRAHTKGNSLYRNRGDGTFEYTGASEGVEMGRWAWSADGVDFDLDGVPEIFVTTGMISHAPEKDAMSFFWRQVVARSPAGPGAAPAYENGWNCLNQLIREDYSWNGHEPNVLYVRRDGRYRDYSGVSGVDFALDSRAFAVTDFDGDGRPDLFLKNRLGPQLLALRNDSAGERQALVIELEGVKSNRDAIGARVQVENQTQWLAAGSGYLSQHTKRLYFARGGTVRVRWPSGAEQEFPHLAAGFRHRLTEGSPEYTRHALQARPGPAPARPVRPTNDPVFEPTWLLEPLPLPEGRRRRGYLFLVDSTPPVLPSDVPIEVVDLRRSPPGVAAAYALFRRYLFDYRAGLRLPLVFLLDEQGMARKVYPALPDAAVLRQDLARFGTALPFPGRYYHRPGRNHFRLGAAFFWAGYPEYALPYLKEVVRREPANFKGHLALGQIALEAGRLEEAQRYLEAASRLGASPELWNNFGGLEMARGNHAAALGYFEKALALQPDLPYALINAGQAHQRLGNAAAAEEQFRRALELQPQDADAANHLGLLLAKQGQSREAVRLFQQAIAARRDHAQAINNLGVLYVQMRQLNDAIAAFRYGIQTSPDYETFYLNLARVYAELGEKERARQVLDELLSRQPENPRARKALAELAGR
jgi:tetratricopeptide (TPR) repeat protein